MRMRVHDEYTDRLVVDGDVVDGGDGREADGLEWGIVGALVTK